VKATLGTVYAALTAGHEVGDHVLQTDDQAAGKAGSFLWGQPMAGHVGSYIAAQAAALRLVGVPLLRWRTLAGLAFSAASHALIDRRWLAILIMEKTGSSNFAYPQTRVVQLRDDEREARGEAPVSTGPVALNGPYLVDQSLHYACNLIAAKIIAGGGNG
jgi:hypothetical protein